MGEPRRFRNSKRWKLAKGVTRILDVTRPAEASVVSGGILANQFHPSNVLVFIVDSPAFVGRQAIEEIQNLLTRAGAHLAVTLEFTQPAGDPRLGKIRGLRITNTSLSCYEGSDLAALTGDELLRRFAAVDQATADTLRRIARACDVSGLDTDVLEDIDYWSELASRISGLLDAAGVKRNVEYKIAPYSQGLKCVGLLLKKDFASSTDLRKSLEGGLVGTNPWEVLISDLDNPGGLLATIFDGGSEAAPN